MHSVIENFRDAEQLRARIDRGNPGERLRLIERLEEETRALAASTIRESAFEWDGDDCLGSTSVMTVLAAAAAIDPANPDWPGRDRVFLPARNDLLAFCCALSTLGSFPPERTAAVVDRILEEPDARTAGVEPRGGSIDDILLAARESGFESARSKRRWREFFPRPADRRWADRDWAGSPAAWKTFLVLGEPEHISDTRRALPRQETESAAGFVAVVAVRKRESARMAEEWRGAGWQIRAHDESERPALLDSFLRPAPDAPLAILVAVDGGNPTTGISQRRRRDGDLLGDLPDDQFNAIIEASL